MNADAPPACPQPPTLMSVRHTVAFGPTSWWRRLSVSDGRRVNMLLDRSGLSARAESRPATLAGGQQRRVALAGALACQPRVLLLDEPFAALDPALRGEWRQRLADVCEQWGIAALMISHDAQDVLEFADVAFVHEGVRSGQGGARA